MTQVEGVHIVPPLPKQERPQQGTQDHIQMASGDLQGGDPKPLGNLKFGFCMGLTEVLSAALQV